MRPPEQELSSWSHYVSLAGSRHRRVVASLCLFSTGGLRGKGKEGLHLLFSASTQDSTRSYSTERHLLFALIQFEGDWAAVGLSRDQRR